MKGKSVRAQVFNKYGGKCCWCGEVLQNGWHVDHREPVVRLMKRVEQHWRHKETKEKIELAGFRKLREMQENEASNWQYMPAKEVFDRFQYPERNTVENMMPACASCNINKHGESIEGFRAMIEKFVNSLNSYSTQYKIAKRYGLIQETQAKVIFYFEKLNNAA